MARSISGVSGAASTGSSNGFGAVASGSFVAAESLSIGNIGVLTEGGVVRKRIPNFPIARENNNTAGPVASIPFGTVQSSQSNKSYMWSDKMALLGNGNLACASVNSSNHPGFVICEPVNGKPIATPTVCEATAVNTDIQILKLSADAFAVVWDIAGYVRFAVYGNDGTQITAPTQVAAFPAGTQLSRYGGAVVLADGNILFSLCDAVNQVYGYRFTPAGVQVGAAISFVLLSTNNSTGVTVPLSGGGFLFCYMGNGQDGLYLRKYDATGVQVGATKTVTAKTISHASLGNIAMRKRCKVLELQNGNIAVMYTTSTAAAGAYVTLYSSALAVVRADILVDADTTDYSGTLGATGGDLIVLTNSRVSLYSSAGYLKTYFSVAAARLTNYVASIVVFNGVNFVVGYWETDLTGTDAIIHTYSAGGVLVGTSAAIRYNNGDGYTTGTFVNDPAGSIMYFFYTQSVGAIFQLASYLTQRSSIVGVVQSAATTGQDVTIGTAGVFSLPATEMNLGNFDATTSAVPGTRGIIAGKTAYLLAIK